MTVTYDPSDLDKTTESGRLNIVRLNIGDTDITAPQLQDEEIQYLLGEAGDDPQAASIEACYLLGNKYSREVDIDIDGQLSISFSDLAQKFYSLAQTLQSKKSSLSLGVFGGALTKADVITRLNDTTKVQSKFISGQFDNPQYKDLDT